MIKLFAVLFMVLVTSTIYCQRHAVYIPADKLARIKIDGKTNDWDWVPQRYFIKGEDMNNNYLISNSTYHKENWDCKIFIAWSDVRNRIYIVATVYDNIKKSNPEWLFGCPNLFDDHLNVIINPDNRSGNCWNNLTYPDIHRLVKVSMHTPFSKGDAQLVIDYGPSWFNNYKELITYGWGNKGDCSEGRCETTYEIEMALWDEWSELGIEYSLRHILEPDKSIRLAIVVDDVDKSKSKIDDEWMTCSQPKWFNIIVQMPEFILDSDDNLWSGIKNALKP
jgi:hypothetical protein